MMGKVAQSCKADSQDQHGRNCNCSLAADMKRLVFLSAQSFGCIGGSIGQGTFTLSGGLTILDGGLLAAALTSCGGEHASRFAGQLACSPEAASGVEERLHLGSHTAESACVNYGARCTMTEFFLYR
jgi:hypothetical protein